MCRWLVASGVIALASAERSRMGAANPIAKIVKLLTDMEKQIKDDVEKQEKAYKKVDCAATKQIEANEKLIAQNEDKIDVAKTEEDGLDSTTLTDESQNLSDQIAETNDEIEKQNKALEDAIAKYEMTKKDLDDGIAALQDAKGALAGDISSSYSGFLSKMSKLKAVPTKHNTMLSNMMKVAEEPGKNLDTIKDMCDTLLQEFQEERNDVELSHNQDKAAQEALIKELNDKKTALQEAFNNGDGERAAKEKRRAELQEIQNNAKKENDDARAENALAVDVKAKAKDQWNKFQKDMINQLGALNKAMDILQKDRGNFQKVTGNNFLQMSMFTVSKAEATSAVRMLIDSIKDFRKELADEAKDIDESVAECDADSRTALENGNQAAEQMDGHQAAIEAALSVIAAEQKRQTEITEEIQERNEERIEKNKAFKETTDELNKDAGHLDDAVDTVKEAVKALKEYDADAAEKTNFHGSDEGNVFEGVIAMLVDAKEAFKHDAANLRNQVDELTKENDEMNAEVGTPSDNVSPVDLEAKHKKEEQKKREEEMSANMSGPEKFRAEKAAKKAEEAAGLRGGVADPIDMPESIIGLLEKERNDSILKTEDEAQQSKSKNENELANENRKLYGDDGEGGIWGGIKKRQQQCDYWMINGPVRQEAIASERKALEEAVTVLEADKELGLAEGDEATLEKRDAGADMVDHGFNKGSS